MRLSRRDVLCLAGATALAGAGACIPSARLKRPLDSTPRDLGDGWEIAAPEAVGLEPTRVRRAYERVFSEDEFLDTISLLVIGQGKLVAEGYTRDPADATRAEFVQSVTKSVCSMAFGIVRETTPALSDLDAPIARWLDVRDPVKREITLRHLLTMRAGIDIEQDTFNIETTMNRQREVTSWILSQPSFARPGETFRYADYCPQLLAAVIRAATGETVEDIARRALLSPLGITDVAWEHDADDEPFAGYGLKLRPRDLAKIGELTRRRGRRDERSLVPEAWLDVATAKQSDSNRSRDRGLDYGFYFWIVPELQAFSTWGHGGNFTLVVPARELVVVLTGMPNAGDQIAPELWDAVDLTKTLLGV